MTGNGGFLVAIFAAAGLHVAALGSIVLPDGGGGAGHAGRDSLSLVMAGAEVAALVEAWEAQPDVADAPDAVQAPESVEAPTVVASLETAPRVRTPANLARTDVPATQSGLAPATVTRMAAPSVDGLTAPIAMPDTPALPVREASLQTPNATEAPRIDTVAPEVPDFAVVTSKRPTSRPPKPAPQAVAKVAAGSGQGATRGTSRTKAVASQPSTKAQAAAQAAWAAAIQREIARAQVYPRGARGSGRVRLALTITSGGSLAGVRVATSSGVSAFDTAAIRAAKRAAPFPKAPSELQKTSFAFGQWVSFQR